MGYLRPLTPLIMGALLVAGAGPGLAMDLRAGIRYRFRGNMGLFGEYRFTSFSADFEGSVLGTKIKTAFDANTHHVLVGLNYSF